MNVGKGHTTIIDFPSGRLSVVDIDDSLSFNEDELDEIAEMLGKKSVYEFYKSYLGQNQARDYVKKSYDIQLTDPVKYLQQNFTNRTIFRFMLTHPDMDHMSGLARLLNLFRVENFWDTKNTKVIPSNNWGNSPYNKNDWDIYQQIRECSSDPKSLHLQRTDQGQFWTDDGIEILSPTPELAELANKTLEYNHISYVIRINYNNRHILLPGDATVEVLEDILDKKGSKSLKADILLAPHHGSKSCLNEDALSAINPDFIIVSVAVGVDYAYQEYSKYGEVLSTKWFGNIDFSIDDSGMISYHTEHKR